MLTSIDLDRYGYWMEAGGASPGTVRLRRTYAERYLRHLESTGRSLVDATVSDVAGFLSNQSWKPATRATARSSLASIHAWAVIENMREDNPVDGVRGVRIPPSPPKLCSESDYENALEAARGQYRDTFVLLLAGYAGLRRNEIATLHADNITDRGLRVTGKGGRTRMIPVHPILQPYLDAAQATGGWFFPGSDPALPVCSRTINRIVNRYLPDGFSTHSLRHRFATMVHYGSKDLRAVQELLGHSSLATTQRYVSVSHDDLTLAVGSLHANIKEAVDEVTSSVHAPVVWGRTMHTA